MSRSSFDASRVRAFEDELRAGSPRTGRRRRSRRYDLGTALLWGGGVLTLVAVLFIAANGAQRLFGEPPASAATVPSTQASTLPELAVAGPPGSAAHAQQLVRVRAEAFAACVFRAGRAALRGGVRVTGAEGAMARPPAYAACDSGRAIGLAPSEISRRGGHGPIDGRGARRGLGLFTVHGGREAWLLQYDASGTGWGYSFDASGNVEAQCRTRKGRLCWDLENDPVGALFLGDGATVAVLAAVLRDGRDRR